MSSENPTRSYNEPKKHKPPYSSTQTNSYAHAPPKPKTKQAQFASLSVSREHLTRRWDIPDQLPWDDASNGALSLSPHKSMHNDLAPMGWWSSYDSSTRDGALVGTTNHSPQRPMKNDLISIGGWISPEPPTWTDTSKVTVNLPRQYQNQPMENDLAPIERWSHEGIQQAPWNNIESFSVPTYDETEMKEVSDVNAQWCDTWSTEVHSGTVYNRAYESQDFGIERS